MPQLILSQLRRNTLSSIVPTIQWAEIGYMEDDYVLCRKTIAYVGQLPESGMADTRVAYVQHDLYTLDFLDCCNSGQLEADRIKRMEKIMVEVTSG